MFHTLATMYVAYMRVSTQRQSLGLEAQRESVERFAGSQVLAEYVEKESGKKDERPQLNRAINQARKTGSTLLIAKLDRLSRNAAFIFQLKNSGVKFVCCDMPEANDLTIGILAVLAEDERKRISTRTREGLQALKRRGKKLGTPENLTDAGRQKAWEANRKKAASNPNNQRASAYISELRSKGWSYQKIADHLNDNGYQTSRGCTFSAMTVKRLYQR